MLFCQLGLESKVTKFQNKQFSISKEHWFLRNCLGGDIFLKLTFISCATEKLWLHFQKSKSNLPFAKLKLLVVIICLLFPQSTSTPQTIFICHVRILPNPLQSQANEATGLDGTVSLLLSPTTLVYCFLSTSPSLPHLSRTGSVFIFFIKEEHPPFLFLCSQLLSLHFIFYYFLKILFLSYLFTYIFLKIL